MDPTTLAAVSRRFPLLGRPRPACPSLAERVRELDTIAHAARQAGADQLAEGAHALNMAALIVSDSGLPDLARALCWQHIDIYRTAAHPLTVLQARYMLEPVLNLARLQIRASDGDRALRLLTTMFDAVRSGTDLTIDGHTLPLTDLVGTRQEHHKLREWVWLHLIGDGIRALVLAGRWDDAVAHADAHRGIGLHLMEGRQATIVARCLKGDLAAARAALGDSTPEHPWEVQVASCLAVMCSDADRAPANRHVSEMMERFIERKPIPGYAFFRAQLGLTVATLAASTDRDTASHILTQVTDEVIESRDGYAAREVLRHRDMPSTMTGEQRAALTKLLNASGLGTGTLPEPLLQNLLDSTGVAAEALSRAVSRPARKAH